MVGSYQELGEKKLSTAASAKLLFWLVEPCYFLPVISGTEKKTELAHH